MELRNNNTCDEQNSKASRSLIVPGPSIQDEYQRRQKSGHIRNTA